MEATLNNIGISYTDKKIASVLLHGIQAENQTPLYPCGLKFLDDVKDRIQDSRIRIATSVNKEMIQLYWWIGNQIVEKQEQLGWGKSVVEKLSKDL